MATGKSALAAALHLQPALLRVGMQLLGCWTSHPTPNLLLPALLPSAAAWHQKILLFPWMCPPWPLLAFPVPLKPAVLQVKLLDLGISPAGSCLAFVLPLP